MEKELVRIFNKIEKDNQDALADTIWTEIKKRKKRSALIRVFVSSSAGILSLVGFIPMFKIMLEELSQSGIYEYLSIMFSGNSSILSYWEEFILSIMESLPATSIAMSLILLFVLFFSMRSLSRQIIKSQFYFA